MNALFYSVKGAGHVNPTLPLARGLIGRGHDVTYTLTAEWKDRLEAMGCRYRNTGVDDEPFTTAAFHPSASFYRQLLPATAALLPRLVEEARASSPDVIIFDSCAPWGYAIAEILGVPGICSVSTLVFDREEVRRELGDPRDRLDPENLEALDEIERRWGIDFRERDIGLFYGRENLVFSCEDLNPTRANVRGTFHFVGPTLPSGVGGDLGDLGHYARGRRRIYVSMGTVVGTKAGFDRSFFAPFIDAFGGREGYELLLSVGAVGGSFNALPSNVTVRPFVPQTAVLAQTDVFITHVGANSMHEGLFHGVPLVCTPHFGDQQQNANRIVEQGAGVLLPLAAISAQSVRSKVEQVMNDGSFLTHATRLGKSLRACGGLDRALDLIEAARTSKKTRHVHAESTPSPRQVHAKSTIEGSADEL